MKSTRREKRAKKLSAAESDWKYPIRELFKLMCPTLDFEEWWTTPAILINSEVPRAYVFKGRGKNLYKRLDRLWPAGKPAKKKA